MPDLAVVFDNQQVAPGGTVSGNVFVNYEGSARSVTVSLVNREHQNGMDVDRVIQSEVIATPEGLRPGQRFPFSFAVPLEATAVTSRPRPRVLAAGWVTGGQKWGVAARIDRPGMDHKAFAGLMVVPPPSTVPAMALVMPDEISRMQRDPGRGINTPQMSLRGFLRPTMLNPADRIGIRCDPPAARQGQALMVDVNVPVELGTDFSLGLFLYLQDHAVNSLESGTDRYIWSVWSEAVPVQAAGVSRIVMRVPTDASPTRHGRMYSTWWDVRPCHGSSTKHPSQRSSQPVVIRP